MSSRSQFTAVSAGGVDSKRVRTLENYEELNTSFRNPNASATGSNRHHEVAIDRIGSSGAQGPPSALVPVTYAEKLQQYRANLPSKKNNIWGELLEAEAMAETAQQFDMISVVDNFSILRGSETYMVGPKRKRKAVDVNPGDCKVNTIGQRQGEAPTDEDFGDESDSSISSGGLSDESKQDLMTKKARRRKLMTARRSQKNPPINKPPLVKTETPNLQTQDAREDGELVDGEANMEVDAELEPRRKGRSVGFTILEEKMKDMLDYKVAHYIANKLKENKKHLFLNTMKLLGREKTLKIFFKTLKIERLGGLQIKNKSRRRTPGGVFLYLVRSDSRLNKASVDEIFKTEREFRKGQKAIASEENTRRWWTGIAGKVEEKLGIPAKKPAEAAVAPPNSDEEAEEAEHSYVVPQTEVPNLQPPPPPAPPQLQLPVIPHPHVFDVLKVEKTRGRDQPVYYGDLDF